MAFREVGVQPDFDSAIAVDAYEILLNSEVADEMEQFFEAIEAAEKNIQIFREGDIFNITEPNRHMFDIYPSVVVGVAELLGFLGVDELGVDNGVFALPPLEKLQVLLVLGLIMEVDLVLLQLLAGEVVAVDVGQAVFGAVVASERGDQMPVFALEGGWLIGF